MKLFERIHNRKQYTQEGIDSLKVLHAPLTNLILKTIIYQDTTGEFDSWIHEIKMLLWGANIIQKTRKGKKFSYAEYATYVFWHLGDDKQIVVDELEHFRLHQLYEGRYPAVIISNKLLDAVYYTFILYQTTFGQWFSQPNEITTKYIENEIKDIWGASNLILKGTWNLNDELQDLL